MGAKLGRQTPTSSVVLSYSKSKGKEAIELYERTGRKAQKWQSNLLKDVLAINKEGLWVHTKYGYSVPRRNGKNEIVAIREMWGLSNGEHILHTAHRTTTTHAAWERLIDLLSKADIKIKSSYRALGRENIELKDGGKIEFRTRTSKSGLGEGFDLLVIDEAQEYQDDQESALKYVVSDSRNPQTLFCGTPPTPTSSGTVFVKLRNAALEGTSVNTGWAEWSVPDMVDDIHDRALWYETNPSLGTILTERKILDEIGADTVDFNIQRLGLWLKYNQKSDISIGEWDELRIDTLPKLKGKLFIGVKYGVDGANVAMSIAVKTEDNKIFVEAIDCRPIRAGNDWIIDFLRQADFKEIAIDGAGGQNILKADMKDSGIKKEPILPTVKEIITANAAFKQGIYEQTICHKEQPSLSQVIGNCEKRPIGSNGGYGFKSQKEGYEIALMDSVIIAFYLASKSKDNTKKQSIAY